MTKTAMRSTGGLVLILVLVSMVLVVTTGPVGAADTLYENQNVTVGDSFAFGDTVYAAQTVTAIAWHDIRSVAIYIYKGRPAPMLPYRYDARMVLACPVVMI
jgi:hypothetical protein